MNRLDFAPYRRSMVGFDRLFDLLEKQAQNVEAYRGLVDCFYALSRPEEAKKAIDHGRTVLPNNETLREMALLHETNYGDPLKVLTDREQILDRNRRCRRGHIERLRGRRAHGQIHIVVAQEFLRRTGVNDATITPASQSR